MEKPNKCCFFGQKCAQTIPYFASKVRHAMYEHRAYNHCGCNLFIPDDKFNDMCYDVSPCHNIQSSFLSDWSDELLLSRDQALVLPDGIYRFANDLEFVNNAPKYNPYYAGLEYFDHKLNTLDDYILRNQKVLDKCSCAIFYYNPELPIDRDEPLPSVLEPYMSNYLIKKAYEYALDRHVKIINIYELEQKKNRV